MGTAPTHAPALHRLRAPRRVGDPSDAGIFRSPLRRRGAAGGRGNRPDSFYPGCQTARLRCARSLRNRYFNLEDPARRSSVSRCSSAHASAELLLPAATPSAQPSLAQIPPDPRCGGFCHPHHRVSLDSFSPGSRFSRSASFTPVASDAAPAATLPAPVKPSRSPLPQVAVTGAPNSAFRRVQVGANEVDYVTDDVTIRHFKPTSPRARIQLASNEVRMGRDVTIRYFGAKPNLPRTRP